MKTLTFAQAIEDALAQAMAADSRIIIWGEDVQMLRVNLLTRFGAERVLAAPISEAAFLGAAVTAAMGGLRPVVEIMLLDFMGVAMDALLNHAAKTEAFTDGNWKVPLVVRAACGGGYGDGGQHEQALWGWLAHIPGLAVVVPCTPADAAGLMLSSIKHDGPVIYLEHKLLSDYWLDYLGAGGRKTVSYDVPKAGARDPVPQPCTPVPLGQAISRLDGRDITIAGVGVGIHRALQVAEPLGEEGISAEVIDLRSVSPLDTETVAKSVAKTGHLIVVNEDYRDFGLSGELAARLLENGLSFKFDRVCVEETIPYARPLEEQALPNVHRILRSCRTLLNVELPE